MTSRIIDNLRKDRKVVITSFIIIPAAILLTLVRRYIEQFRGTELYTYGATMCLLMYIALILISSVLLLNVVLNFRKYNRWTNMVAVFLGASLFLFVLTGMIVDFVRLAQ